MWKFNDQKFDKKFKDKVKPYKIQKTKRDQLNQSSLPPMKFDFDKNQAVTPLNNNQEASMFNSIQMNKTIMNETLFQTFGETDQLSLTTSQHIRVKDIFDGDTPKAQPSFPTIIPKQQRLRDKPPFLDEF